MANREVNDAKIRIGIEELERGESAGFSEMTRTWRAGMTCMPAESSA